MRAVGSQMTKGECDVANLRIGRLSIPGAQLLRIYWTRLLRSRTTGQRLRLLAGFTWLQAAIQALAALSGLLLVRVLEKPQFAAYTIATSLLSTLNGLTDCGIGTGLNVIGGRVWRDRAALGSLVASALQVRARLAGIALPLGLTLALILFRQNQVPWCESIGLVIATWLGLAGVVVINTSAVALRLHGKYLEVQRIELTAVLVRLALLISMALVCINAILAMVVATLSVALQTLLIRCKTASIMEPHALPDREKCRAIGRFVAQQWFSTVFFAFQGQITLFLMCLWGSPEKVAEVSALGRLAVIFGFITSLLNGVATPTLARCNSVPRLRRLAAGMVLAYGFFAGTMLAITFLFPRHILWLLGGRYAGLSEELPLVVAASLIWGLTGVLFGLASARGWIWHAWVSPFFTVALQALLLTWLDLSQVRGVLQFGLLSSLPVLGSVMYMVARGLMGNRAEPTADSG